MMAFLPLFAFIFLGSTVQLDVRRMRLMTAFLYKSVGCKPKLRLQLSRHGNCVMGVSD
jgi:hypothetical protein